MNLDEEFQTLKNLCADIDPYQPLSEEVRKKLESFNIKEWDTPLDLTNQLITLLNSKIIEKDKLQ